MNIKHAIVTTLLAVACIGATSQAHAATISLESTRARMSVGDTAVITVRISSEGAILNTVDGQIQLNGTKSALTVAEFSLASSSFGLWPRTPSLSSDGKTISFVGGVPGGFSIENATIFKIVVHAIAPGTVHVQPANINVFANDGKGTRVSATAKGVDILVGQAAAGATPINDWSGMVSSDKTPPEPFIIVLGRDASLFDGNTFAFFSAVDNQTGIDHYDVSEDGGPYVRSGSTYVPRNQSESVKLNVIAYDKAGNIRASSYGGRHLALWQIIAIVLIVIVAGYGTYRALFHSSHA